MSNTREIALADEFSGQYRDESAFMAALAGKISVEMRRIGWGGCKVLDVTFEKLDGRTFGSIRVGPGHGRCDLDAVRAVYRAKLALRQAQDEAQKKAAKAETLL